MSGRSEAPVERELAGLSLAIVAYADLGRSPRMVAHALAAAEYGAEVTLVGLEGTPLPRELVDVGVRVHRIPVPTTAVPVRAGPLGMLAASLRAVRGAAALANVFSRLPTPGVILCATPPAVPILPVVPWFARHREAQLVIDWHNFGPSLLALKLGRHHPAVSLLEWTERRLAMAGTQHLCVSEAMRKRLQSDFAVADPVVVYDRPDDRFVLARDACVPPPIDRTGKPQRATALVVAPTGWTLDENPAPLLEALIAYDRSSEKDDRLPKLQVVITGRGPLRDSFEERICDLKLTWVELRTAWLSQENYVDLLAAADLGISLHTSSSGVDLAMKVADMLGAGLPVCAHDYGPCLLEQLRPGADSILYGDAESLAGTLCRVLSGYPNSSSELAVLRRRTSKIERPSWTQEWRQYVAPLLASCLTSPCRSPESCAEGRSRHFRCRRGASIPSEND